MVKSRFLLLLLIANCSNTCLIDAWATENSQEDIDRDEQNDKNEEQNDEKNADNLSSSNKQNTSLKTGFYSGFRLGLHRNELHGDLLSGDDGLNSTTSKIKTDKNNLEASFLLGVDKNFGSVVVGIGSFVGFNPGSEVKYSEKFDVAKVKSGTEYSTFAKLGFILNRIMLYGKTGLELSNYKYDFTVNDLAKEKKEWSLFPTFGAGVEFSVCNGVSLVAECSYGEDKTADKLNISAGSNKTKNTSGRTFSVKLGCNYRF